MRQIRQHYSLLFLAFATASLSLARPEGGVASPETVPSANVTRKPITGDLHLRCRLRLDRLEFHNDSSVALTGMLKNISKQTLHFDERLAYRHVMGTISLWRVGEPVVYRLENTRALMPSTDHKNRTIVSLIPGQKTTFHASVLREQQIGDNKIILYRLAKYRTDTMEEPVREVVDNILPGTYGVLAKIPLYIYSHGKPDGYRIPDAFESIESQNILWLSVRD